MDIFDDDFLTPPNKPIVFQPICLSRHGYQLCQSWQLIRRKLHKRRLAHHRTTRRLAWQKRRLR